MRFVLIFLIFLSGCSYNFKNPFDSQVKDEIVIEELEPLEELEKVKQEMRERLEEIKDE
tara:strand:- start:399 stop:575 length:177 start_codon:yes stop_codon:yes gene_type:complete